MKQPKWCDSDNVCMKFLEGFKEEDCLIAECRFHKNYHIPDNMNVTGDYKLNYDFTAMNENRLMEDE